MLSGATLRAEDVTLLGGDLSSDLQGRAAIQVFAPNISEENKTAQLSGFAPFHDRFDFETGLGPKFINRSCGDCHVGNGRGPVRLARGANRLSTVVVKVSQGNDITGAPINVKGVGEQIQDANRRGRDIFGLRLEWLASSFTINGVKIAARKPVVSFSLPAGAPSEVGVSLRMTPIIIGVGLLEAISEDTILELSDPYDRNDDGISGRPQYVPDLIIQELKLGRFGFKASHPTIEQQSAAAAFHDMGVTNKYFPGRRGIIELSDEQFENMVVYLALAGVPKARDQGDEKVIKGQLHFKDIGCADCHVMTLKTGEHRYSELSNQTIHPFTDLLLHDMGEGLSDTRPEYEASAREWRTTPLWGLGYSASVSEVKPLYLHDGRAKTIEEAILWHDGEARRSRKAFQKLSDEDSEALLAFLRSL
jgi:CxxC motif-containing protein (DUF1111 family)